MAVYKLLQRSAFDPETIRIVTTAYEDALRALQISDRSNPIAEILAKKIIEIAQTGERDPAQIRRRALRALAARRAD